MRIFSSMSELASDIALPRVSAANVIGEQRRGVVHAACRLGGVVALSFPPATLRCPRPGAYMYTVPHTGLLWLKKTRGRTYQASNLSAAVKEHV